MKKKERVLTPQEEKRKQNYDGICQQLQEKGYERTDLIVDVVTINIAAIFVMLPWIVLFCWIYFSIHSEQVFTLPLTSAAVFFLIVLLLMVVHELIHGITWGIMAPNGFHAISFGIIWSMLTPYCTCADPLKKWQYFIGTAMPTLILGFGLGVAAILQGSILLFYLALVMILAGGGDFFILWKLLRYHTNKKEILCIDHPYECGLTLFER